jgi:hypothetical protein
MNRDKIANRLAKSLIASGGFEVNTHGNGKGSINFFENDYTSTSDELIAAVKRAQKGFEDGKKEFLRNNPKDAEIKIDSKEDVRVYGDYGMVQQIVIRANFRFKRDFPVATIW